MNRRGTLGEVVRNATGKRVKSWSSDSQSTKNMLKKSEKRGRGYAGNPSKLPRRDYSPRGGGKAGAEGKGVSGGPGQKTFQVVQLKRGGLQNQRRSSQNPLEDSGYRWARKTGSEAKNGGARTVAYKGEKKRSYK